MVQYIKEIAIQEQKKKITLDVHQNLRIYNNDYKNRGFVLTEHRSRENHNWIETELVL